jgi:hypothetical protein
VGLNENHTFLHCFSLYGKASKYFVFIIFITFQDKVCIHRGKAVSVLN